MSAARRVEDRAASGAHPTPTEVAVLGAARRLLETVPLSQLSVSQLIGEAGISRATFYFYFSSKFAVLAALVAHLVEELKVAFEGHGASDAELEKSIEDRLRVAGELWRRNRSLLHAVAENWHGVPELQALWLEVIDRLTELITSEVVGLRQPVDPAVIRPQAAALAWAIERYLYVSGLCLHPGVADEDAALPAIKQMWLGVLLGPRLVDDLGGCHTRPRNDWTG
jgi:AcrR family transcriptional regulator